MGNRPGLITTSQVDQLAARCKPTLTSPGMDYKPFVIHLFRLSRLMGVAFDDVLFELRPLEHTVAQDAHFTLLLKRRVSTKSRTLRLGLLRAAAIVDGQDLEKEHLVRRQARMEKIERLGLRAHTIGDMTTSITRDHARAQNYRPNFNLHHFHPEDPHVGKPGQAIQVRRWCGRVMVMVMVMVMLRVRVTYHVPRLG